MAEQRTATNCPDGVARLAALTPHSDSPKSNLSQSYAPVNPRWIHCQLLQGTQLAFFSTAEAHGKVDKHAKTKKHARSTLKLEMSNYTTFWA